eukprot:13388677-Heterocapsa_arctica.AAC.1
MGRKGEEMAQTAGAESEVKYKARGVYAGSNIQSKAIPAHELFQEVPMTPAILATARAAMASGALKAIGPRSGTPRPPTFRHL